MRVLSLDLSTHTGWSVLESPEGKLIEYGLLEMDLMPEDYIDTPYPFNYIAATEQFGHELASFIETKRPNVIVIEETVPGREVYSQKLIEGIHHELLRLLVGIKVVYLRTGSWRSAVDLRMSKADLKGNQKKNLLKAKQKARELRGHIKALGTKKVNADHVAELKFHLSKLQLGRVTRKHLAVRKVNELFGLDFGLDKHNEADSILLGMAYLKGAPICDGLRPKHKKEQPA